MPSLRLAVADAHTLRIAASLWSVDQGQQREALERVVAAGVDAMHWDLADGALGPAGGFTPERVEALTSGVTISSEAHLMVARPLVHVDAWTDMCERIVVHVESAGWREALDRIASRGCTPALAVSPTTPGTAVPNDVDDVLVMSVAPGTPGSGFLSDAPSRALSIAQSAHRRSLGWDGSVDLEQVALAPAANVDWLVSGGGLVGHAHGAARWIARARSLWAGQLPR